MLRLRTYALSKNTTSLVSRLSISAISRARTAPSVCKPTSHSTPHRKASQKMRIAVEGCCHGELDAIYRHIQQLETKNGYKVDLLLVCGDFQAVRNHQDLQCMAVPNKYKELKDFHKYYMGEKAAPILTLVIGGNHEASNYLWELYHGGWLAPNIYYLGHAGCVQVNGIRIAGTSGIFKPHDFRLGHYEKLPYDQSALRSTYHTREYSIRRLSLLSSPRIFLSHDWPQSIENYGDLQSLLRYKTFLRQDIESGRLGSPPLMSLLQILRPEWWFSAHLHTRYEAVVRHVDSTTVKAPQNPDEIAIDEEEEEEKEEQSEQTNTEVEQSQNDSASSRQLLYPETKFLALDKCLPKRKFLEVINVSGSDNQNYHSSSGERRQPILEFDPEWLAITRAFHPWLSTTRSQRPFPDEGEARNMVSQELEWVKKNIGKKMVSECQTFKPTAPGPSDILPGMKISQPCYYPNPQTQEFCGLLGIENRINP